MILKFKNIFLVVLILQLNSNLLITKQSELDSASQITKIGKSDSLYIPLNEFLYADNQRFSLSGNPPFRKTHLKLVPSILFGTGLTAVFIAQHIGQLNTIWKDMGNFRFVEDITQDLWVDKFGHFYGAYFTGYLLSETLIEVGMSWDAASTWGGVLGLSYSTYVEILDGFGKNWGFSPSDFYADFTGAAFFIGQHYFPVLQNFTPKFIYIPAEWFGDKSRQPSSMFIDDYSSQTFWLSVNVYNFLPDNYKEYWPSWLQLSLGYTARNLCEPKPNAGYDCDPNSDVKTQFVWGSPRYIVALDYDLVKLLPDGPNFWNWFKQTLNHFKLPSPAIEFSKNKTRFYLIFPFKF